MHHISIDAIREEKRKHMEKKRKLSLKLLLMTIIMTVSMLGSMVVAFADYSTADDVIRDYAPGGNKGQSALPGSLAGIVLTAKPANGTIIEVVVGSTTYYYDANNAQTIIDAGNNLEKSAAASANNQAALDEFTQVTEGMGLQADIKTASGMMSGFYGVLRTLLGIIVVGASVGMTVYSGFDICYIAFPVFRNKCEDAKASGGGMMVSGKKGSGGANKLRFVSDDVQDAVRASTTTQEGTNPFVIYFKKRLLSYLVLAILLFILLTGKITIFTDIALRLVSGILKIIQTV